MITHDHSGEVTITGITGIQDMGLKVTGKSFALLIDKLYTRKEDAVVRELGANARDAMNDLARQTGTEIQPFSINLPNDICHELIVTDNGTGLSKDNVLKFFGTLFESSKENENNSIGAYGLGSKSPFAVTDAYIIQSRFNGELHSFSFFRAKSGIPQLVHIGTEPTDQPNGITFKVPASPNRYSTYAKAVAAQLFFFEPRPHVGAHGNLWEDYGKIVMEKDNWKVIESRGLREYYGSVLANMGGVSYPLDFNRLKDIDTEDDFIEALAKKKSEEEPEVYPTPDEYKAHLTNRGRDAQRTMDSFIRATSSNMVFGLFFNIGELEIPPSRENLEYDGETCYHIICAIEKMCSQITENFVNDIKDKADPKDPVKLRDMLIAKCKIINWDSNGSSVGPSFFCNRIRELSWEIDIATDLPTVKNAFGEDVNGKTVITANSPSRMLDNLKITFPHHQVDKFKTEERRFQMDDQGVNVVDENLMKSVIDKYLKEGYVITKQEKKAHPKLDGSVKYEYIVNLRNDYKEWIPVLWETGDIEPKPGRVTANVGEYRQISYAELKKGDEVDRWGRPTRNHHMEKVVILVDDEEKGKELTKYGTWALRRVIGKNYNQTEQQMLSNDPSQCQKVVTFMIGDAFAFDFYAKWNKKQEKPFEIWKLSELVIPKAERRIGDASLTLRGVKRIEMARERLTRNLSTMLRNSSQEYTFGAIKGGVQIEETGTKYMVFSDGKTEQTYLDPELTIPVSNKLLLLSLAAVYRLMGKTHDDPKDYLYRLTPMNIKNLDKFKEKGFKPLMDAFREIGTDNTVGHHQFKRRYKFSTLAQALYYSDDNREAEYVESTPNREGHYEYSTPFIEFMKHGKLSFPKIDKHLKRVNRGMNRDGIHTDQYVSRQDMPRAMRAGYAFQSKYRNLTEPEAMRIVIDSMLDGGFSDLYKALFGDKVPYMTKVFEHAANNFEKARMNFLKDKYKEVLFGGFFSRDSDEFTNALEIAKVKLG